MSARAESLAKQFETRVTEMTETLEKLTAEKWSVGVTAHHVAGSHEGISGIIKAVSAGQAMPNFTMAMIDEMNATHAREHANCTRAETLALHKKNTAAAAALVRGLSDAALDKSGTVLHGMPAMTTQQIVEGILINHLNEHLASIRAAVGH